MTNRVFFSQEVEKIIVRITRDGDDLRLRFVGSGNAFNDGDLINQGIVIEFPPENSLNNELSNREHLDSRSTLEKAIGYPVFLLDCGPGIPRALRKIYGDQGVNNIEFVLLTHFHGDHIAGLPFLLLNSKYLSKRKTKLVIIGPSGTADHVNGLNKLSYPSALENPGFPIEFIELLPGSNIKIKNGVEFQITSLSVKHRPESLGYRIVVGKKIIAITGDTSWTESLIELGKGADLFIMECNDFTKISPHLNYEEISANENRIGAKKIVLNHLGASMLENLDKVDIETASDGHIIEL